jgi:hypothetical protein
VAPVALGVEVAEEDLVLEAVLMRPTARVILRVTKVSPRRSLSWLKRMPLTANMPYASR